MNWLYGAAVAAGVVGLLAWIGLTVAAGPERSGPQRAGIGPEARFGSSGRTVVGAIAGFGMGGLSASYAGLAAWAAFLAACVGAAAIGAVAARLGPDEGTES